MSANRFDYDDIYKQLCLKYSGWEVKIRAGWVWFGDGMDPLTVVVYDVLNYFEDMPDIPEYEKTFRCMVIFQGKHLLDDHILDYMEGW